MRCPPKAYALVLGICLSDVGCAVLLYLTTSEWRLPRRPIPWADVTQLSSGAFDCLLLSSCRVVSCALVATWAISAHPLVTSKTVCPERQRDYHAIASSDKTDHMAEVRSKAAKEAQQRWRHHMLLLAMYMGLWSSAVFVAIKAVRFRSGLLPIAMMRQQAALPAFSSATLCQIPFMGLQIFALLDLLLFLRVLSFALLPNYSHHSPPIPRVCPLCSTPLQHQNFRPQTNSPTPWPPKPHS